MLSQNTMKGSKKAYSAALLVGVQQRLGTGDVIAKVNVCPGTWKAERTGLQVPINCPESPPWQYALETWPSVAVWLGVGHVPNIHGKQQSFIFIYSLTGGSLALCICSATSISPSKSHSSVSSSLPYISAEPLPIQIPPLLSPKAPEPSTQTLFICFSSSDCLQFGWNTSVLLVEDTLLKANTLCIQTLIMLCTCGNVNLGAGKKRQWFKPTGSPGHLLVQCNEFITTSKHI